MNHPLATHDAAGNPVDDPALGTHDEMGVPVLDENNPEEFGIEIKLTCRARQMGMNRATALIFRALRDAGYTNVDVTTMSDPSKVGTDPEFDRFITGPKLYEAQKRVQIRIVEDFSAGPRKGFLESRLKTFSTNPTSENYTK